MNQIKDKFQTLYIYYDIYSYYSRFKIGVKNVLMVIGIMFNLLITIHLLQEGYNNFFGVILCNISMLFLNIVIINTEDQPLNILDRIKYILNNKKKTLRLIIVVWMLMFMFNNYILGNTIEIYDETYAPWVNIYKLMSCLFPTAFVLHIMSKIPNIPNYITNKIFYGCTYEDLYGKPFFSPLDMKYSVYSVLFITSAYVINHNYIYPLIYENMYNITVKFATDSGEFIQNYREYKTPYSIRRVKYNSFVNKIGSSKYWSSISVKRSGISSNLTIDCRIRNRIKDTMLFAYKETEIGINRHGGLSKKDYYKLMWFLESKPEVKKISLDYCSKNGYLIDDHFYISLSEKGRFIYSSLFLKNLVNSNFLPSSKDLTKIQDRESSLVVYDHSVNNKPLLPITYEPENNVFSSLIPCKLEPAEYNCPIYPKIEYNKPILETDYKGEYSDESLLRLVKPRSRISLDFQVNPMIFVFSPIGEGAVSSNLNIESYIEIPSDSSSESSSLNSELSSLNDDTLSINEYDEYKKFFSKDFFYSVKDFFMQHGLDSSVIKNFMVFDPNPNLPEYYVKGEFIRSKYIPYYDSVLYHDQEVILFKKVGSQFVPHSITEANTYKPIFYRANHDCEVTDNLYTAKSTTGNYRHLWIQTSKGKVKIPFKLRASRIRNFNIPLDDRLDTCYTGDNAKTIIRCLENNVQNNMYMLNLVENQISDIFYEQVKNIIHENKWWGFHDPDVLVYIYNLQNEIPNIEIDSNHFDGFYLNRVKAGYEEFNPSNSKWLNRPISILSYNRSFGENRINHSVYAKTPWIRKKVVQEEVVRTSNRNKRNSNPQYYETPIRTKPIISSTSNSGTAIPALNQVSSSSVIPKKLLPGLLSVDIKYRADYNYNISPEENFIISINRHLKENPAPIIESRKTRNINSSLGKRVNPSLGNSSEPRAKKVRLGNSILNNSVNNNIEYPFIHSGLGLIRDITGNIVDSTNNNGIGLDVNLSDNSDTFYETAQQPVVNVSLENQDNRTQLYIDPSLLEIQSHQIAPVVPSMLPTNTESIVGSQQIAPILPSLLFNTAESIQGVESTEQTEDMLFVQPWEEFE